MITVILGGKTYYNDGGPYVVGGELTEINECTPGLEKRETVLDNDNEHTTVTEYWLNGELVKRGASVYLKTGIFADGVLANFGESNGQ